MDPQKHEVLRKREDQRLSQDREPLTDPMRIHDSCRTSLFGTPHKRLSKDLAARRPKEICPVAECFRTLPIYPAIKRNNAIASSLKEKSNYRKNRRIGDRRKKIHTWELGPLSCR